MTVGELAGEAFLRLRRIISRTLSRATDGFRASYVSDETLRRSLDGRRVAEVASRIREGRKPQLTRGLEELASTVAAVREVFPDSIEESRLEAEAILSHRITLFGRVYNLGQEIDWHRDAQANARWPLDHHSQVPIVLGGG